MSLRDDFVLNAPLLELLAGNILLTDRDPLVVLTVLAVSPRCVLHQTRGLMTFETNERVGGQTVIPHRCTYSERPKYKRTDKRA